MIKTTPYVYGRVIDFTPKVTELNLFTNGEKDEEEGHILNDLITNTKDKLNEPSIKMITGFFNRGFPMIPFPVVERCINLQPSDSHMTIEEGYAIMAFDYTVKKS